MEFLDSAEEARFRTDLRAWLADNNPGLEQSPTDEEYWARAAEWHQSLYRAGWFGLSLPEEFGGKGLPPVFEAILDDELAEAGAPPKPSLAYLAHGMLAHAGLETQRRFLPGMIDGSERWCQGFSEPDAGSDLAGLRTQAARDGDEFVINGHKVWTSYSDVADWCFLLARTDREVAPHRGITAFALPMHQLGIEQRPLRMINGVSNEFGEVILDGARVPVENVIGELGGGWEIAMTILNHERSPADVGYTARYGKAVRALEATVRSQPRPAASTRIELEHAFVHAEMLRFHVKRRLSDRLGGHKPGPEGAIDKLLMTRTEQLVGHAALSIGGAYAMSGDEVTWLNMYLYSRAASVMGGTAQIQKNVIASQILRLPK